MVLINVFDISVAMLLFKSNASLKEVSSHDGAVRKELLLLLVLMLARVSSEWLEVCGYNKHSRVHTGSLKLTLCKHKQTGRMRHSSGSLLVLSLVSSEG